MNQKISAINNKTARPKSKKIIVFASMIILCLAYIITKDIDIPTSVVTTLGILSLTTLFLATFIKTEWVFYVLVAYLPFNKILVGDFGGAMTALNVTNILIVIILLGWFCNSMFKGRKLFQKSPANWPIFIFCSFAVVSLFRGTSYFGTGYFMDYLIPLKRWLTPVFLFYLTLNVVKDKETLKNTVIIVMIAVTIAGLMAIYEYIELGSVSSIAKARVGGIADQANMLGAFFIYYMFIFLGFFLVNWRSIKHWLFLGPFSICVIGMMVTFSRGAYVAFAFGSLATSFFKNKVLFAALVILLIFSIIHPAMLPPGVKARMSHTFAQRAIYSTDIKDIVDKSSQIRLVIWKGALKMIKDYPLLGVGYGVFPQAITFYTPLHRIDAHNTYIIIAAEMGIFALLTFLWILFVLIRHTYRLYRRTKDKFIKSFALGFLGGLAGLMMANMFGSRLDTEEITCYFWIISALVFRAKILEGIDAPRKLKKQGGSN